MNKELQKDPYERRIIFIINRSKLIEKDENGNPILLKDIGIEAKKLKIEKPKSRIRAYLYNEEIFFSNFRKRNEDYIINKYINERKADLVGKISLHGGEIYLIN